MYQTVPLSFVALLEYAKTATNTLDLSSYIETLRSHVRKCKRELAISKEAITEFSTPITGSSLTKMPPADTGLSLLVNAVNLNPHPIKLTLDLSACELTDEDLKILAKLKKSITIIQLNLSQNRLSISGCNTLIQALWDESSGKATFHTLDLRHNALNGTRIPLDLRLGTQGHDIQYDLVCYYKPAASDTSTTPMLSHRSSEIESTNPLYATKDPKHPTILITHQNSAFPEKYTYPLRNGRNEPGFTGVNPREKPAKNCSDCCTIM